MTPKGVQIDGNNEWIGTTEVLRFVARELRKAETMVFSDSPSGIVSATNHSVFSLVKSIPQH